MKSPYLSEPILKNEESHSTPVRISLIPHHFPTPKFHISPSSTFQTACAFLQKTGGVYPKKGEPSAKLDAKRKGTANCRALTKWF